MRINADFSSKVVVIPAESDWVCSPESGVDRLMLDRIGDEVARATSIVRFAPGSTFSRHDHAAGEEFLVLDGVFSDEHADYPAGTYVRNPPGSGHSPHSGPGCRLLVKLRQFDSQDLAHVVIDTFDRALWPNAEGASLDMIELHSYGTEHVMMVRLDNDEPFPIKSDPGGIELFVVSGSIDDQGVELAAEAWLRIPANRETSIVASSNALLWVKTGHLRL